MSPRSARMERTPPGGRAAAVPMASGQEIAGSRAGNHDGTAFGAADLLGLAAAPTFAIMALMTCVLGSGMPDMLCSAATSPLGGMVPMYALMSAFHTAPWLRLISRRRSGGS